MMRHARILLGLLIVLGLFMHVGAWALAASGRPVQVEWAAGDQPHRLLLTGQGESSNSPAIQHAKDDLQDYLNGVYADQTFAQSSRYLPRKGKAILMGTPASFPLITRYVDPARLKKPESFVVTTAREGECELGIIAGADERGVVYGTYALLEKLGYGFYLSHDAKPVKKAEPFSFKGWDLADAPLVPHRVVFDWHNFLSGCSTWNLADWKSWIVQSQKMGYNAVMVHAYGNNPMVEFEMNGQRKPVGYLSTTRSGRDWSTMHVSDVRRLWGGQVFDGPVFGAEAAMVPDERRVEAARKLMHDAFECAKERAMGVYFAFDIETFQANPQNIIQTLPERARFLVPSNAGPETLWLANPDTPEGQAYYTAQVAALLKSYPQITTLVCWFRWSGSTPWMKMKLESMPQAWQAEYRKEIARTPEAAKLPQIEGCFALGKAVQAYARALKALGRPDIAVATGTWDFMFLESADRFMPRDVMFIGLDYSVLHGKSAFDLPEARAKLAAVGAHRPLLPIAWAHHDDGAYLGRSFTPFANFADKLAEQKAAGYGIIHWTTRPLDLYFKSLIEQVWMGKKNRPLNETCAEMAARIFGEAARERGGEYLYKWVTEAPVFSRETSPTFVDRKLDDPTTVAAGCEARLKILDAIPQAALTPDGRDSIEYFRGLERFIGDVHRNEAAYQKSRELLGKGDREGARTALAACDPEAVIERYAKFSSLGGMSRGEQGTVVSMNTRWLPHYQSLRQALGMAPVRMKFGPTQHDPLAQSPGAYTFHFGPGHELWETYGKEETGAEAVTLAEGEKLELPEAMTAPEAELCRSGIRIDQPLTVAVQPILKQRGAAGLVPAGAYRLSLYLLTPAAGESGVETCSVEVSPRSPAKGGGVEWLAFEPFRAKYLRLACHGNNQNMWNSVSEVVCDALERGAAAVSASDAVKGFAAEAAIDGKPQTRWAAQGEHWIQFTIKPGQEVKRLGLQWFGGDKRKARFEVLASDDGKAWRRIEVRDASGFAQGDEPAFRDKFNLRLQTGAVAKISLVHDRIKLTQPGVIEVRLAPGKGAKPLLCAATLEPQVEGK